MRAISPWPGQEDEDAALLLRERAAANSRHGLLDALAWRTPDMARLDRESPAFARQHRRVAEKRRDARSIERRGHDDEAQILAQPRLRVERERKTEIRIERAFMEFIEDHRSDVGERRILEDEAGEHALGHDLEAGVAREARTEPHAKPDRPANLFARLDAMRLAAARAASRRGSRRRMRRSFAQGSARSAKGTTRRLPRSGRRHDHGVGALTQRRQDFRQALLDRERCVLVRPNGYRVQGRAGPRLCLSIISALFLESGNPGLRRGRKVPVPASPGTSAGKRQARAA